MSLMSDQPECTAPRAPGANLDTSLAELFETCRRRLRGLLSWRMRNMSRRLASRIDPSDVLQDAFLAARRQYPRYLRDRAVPEYIWLRRLVENRLKNELRFHLAQRRSMGKERALSAQDWDELSERLAGLRERPDHALTKEEWKQRIRLALHKLPPKYQVVIVLRFFEGKSNHDVATHFHMKYDSAATNLLGRALRRLRQLVEAGQTNGSGPAGLKEDAT
jgi:RNA polymerase sigma-70 factor (ECF subfamily)